MKKIFAFVAIAISLVAVSCTKPAANGDQKEEVKVDLTALNALLSECKTIANAATTDSWSQKAIDDFKAVISTVEKAIPAATTQTAVDNLLAQLKTAKETFLAAEIGAIPADALAWALSFEEGSGTELKTTGKYEWTVKLLPGEEGTPKFVDGHKAGSKGLQFGYGAYGEFQDAVASVLETPTFSIACWVNTAIYENNYILSWNKWDTWKFQTQSTNKADMYFILKDFRSYAEAQNEVERQYRDKSLWAKKAILNVASTGKFSSDRTIQEYIDEIWHLDHVVLPKKIRK